MTAVPRCGGSPDLGSSGGSAVALAKCRGRLRRYGRLGSYWCQRRCGTWTECGARCTKTLLVLVNFAFLICGLVLFGLGFVLYIDRESQLYGQLFHLLPSSGPLIALDKIPVVLAGTGTTILLLSFLGCYGACVESVCFLWLYTILLFAILTAEIVTVTFLAVLRDKVLYLVESNMQSQVKYEYNNTALPRNVSNSSVLRTTAFWDAMQIKLNCCGAVGPQDYKFSEWFNRSRKEPLFVPPSCCLLQNDDPRNPVVVDENVCQINAISFLFDRSPVNKTQLKTRGCGNAALQRLVSNTSVLLCTIVLITILQVLHFLFACSLLSRLRRSWSDYQWYEVNDYG